MDRTSNIISRGRRRSKSAPLLRDTLKDLDSGALCPESGGSPFVKTDPRCNACGTVNSSGLHERQSLTSCAEVGGGVTSTGKSCHPDQGQANIKEKRSAQEQGQSDNKKSSVPSNGGKESGAASGTEARVPRRSTRGPSIESKSDEDKKQAPDSSTLQVMSDDLANTKLRELQGILEQALGTRPTHDGGSSTPVPSDKSLQENAQKFATFYKECGPSEVFGCKPGGVLPPARSDDANSKNGRRIDKAGTVAIRKSIRHQWEARHVRGDGNCLWRSAAHAFFGTDHNWRQLKLLSLAHAAAHVNELHIHVLRNHYDNDISARYAETEFLVLDDGTRVQIPDLARTDLMLLASISKLCSFGTYAGSVACRLIAEALGITVKMLHKFDAKARKQQDLKPRKDGTQRDGKAMDDARWSHTFVPRSTPPQCWRVQDSVVGQASYSFRDEIVIVLVRSSHPLHNPTPATLQALPEVEHDATGADARCNHFAAIVNTDGTTKRPFPMHTCAPALYVALDSKDKKAFTEEFRQWKERDSTRPSKLCATSTADAAGKVMNGQEVDETADDIHRRHSARVAATRKQRLASLDNKKERLRAQQAAASKSKDNRNHEGGEQEGKKKEKKIEKTGKALRQAQPARAPARTGRWRRYSGWKGVAVGILKWGGVILFCIIMAGRWARMPSTNESRVVTDAPAAVRHYYSMFEPVKANKKATEAAAQPRRGSRKSRKKDRNAINNVANQLSSSRAARESAGSSSSSSSSIGGKSWSWSFFNTGDQASSTDVGVPDRSSSSSSTGGKRKGWSFFITGDQASSTDLGVPDSSSSTGGQRMGWSLFNMGEQTSPVAVGVKGSSASIRSTGDKRKSWGFLNMGDQTSPVAVSVPDSSSSTAGKRKGWSFFNMGGQTSSSAAGSSTASSTGGKRKRWSLFNMGDPKTPSHAVDVSDRSTSSTASKITDDKRQGWRFFNMGHKKSSNDVGVPASSTASKRTDDKRQGCRFFNMGHKKSSNDVGVPASTTTSSNSYSCSGSDNDRGVMMTMGDQLFSAVARVASGTGWGWSVGGGGGDMRGGVDRNCPGRDHDEHGTRGAFGRNSAGDERGQKNRRDGRFEGLRRRWEKFGEEFVEAVDGPWV